MSGALPLHVALVEPQIPQNTGNVARTCACTGAALHLIKPMGFTVTDAKLKRAGLDYWDKLDITYYDSLSDFLDNPPGPCVFFTTKAKKRYTEVEYRPGCCLVFGREDAGLPPFLLQDPKRQCVRLPMRGQLRSLNLSNTVAVGVYEALRQWEHEGLQWQGGV
ncbi:tRNA (cytidine(34)-2'-O)-methyltransferase [Ruminococcaceae bacterium OttesenSCG-928-I18]|nr:tRNA (cytidine(34)-2'-O)-methyltransferase [Ruminococcaceae bacterium OttesenSCG-928-I18]